MTSSKAARAASLASLSLLVATTGVPGSALAATNCFEAISEASAKKLFDAFAPAKPSDGCTLENVRTDKSRMTVEWTKAGHVQEAIVIVPTSCVKGVRTHGKMSVIVPASVDNACPAAVDATRTLVESDGLGDPVPITDGTSLPERVEHPLWLRKRTLGLLAGGLALAVSVGGGLVALRRRARKRATGARPATNTPGAAAETGEAEIVAPSSPPAETVGEPHEDPAGGAGGGPSMRGPAGSPPPPEP
jgi:hypothetical protein